MENEIYRILRKHRLTRNKREEVLADLLLLFSDEVQRDYLPKKDVAKVMRWLLGYAPSFPAYKEGEGMYYWRRSLRVKIKKELKMVIGKDRQLVS